MAGYDPNPWKLSPSNVIGWVLGAGAIFIFVMGLFTFSFAVEAGIFMVIMAAIAGAISIFLLFLKGIWAAPSERDLMRQSHEN